VFQRAVLTYSAQCPCVKPLVYVFLYVFLAEYSI
jgi:hypothetical protein